MKCIYCGYEESKVLDSRSTDDCTCIRRRRECLECGRRFTTYETIEAIPILVIKNDGSRQPLNMSKIKSGIIKACEKRPVSLEKIEKMAREIERNLQNNFQQEVESAKIGELVCDQLKNTDEIAYVRFASVYRQFKDLESFKKIIDEL